MNWLDQFRAARRATAPIVIIRTNDYASTIETVRKFYQEIKRTTGICQWDISRGIYGVNPEGEKAAKVVNEYDPPKSPALVTGNPLEALQLSLEKLPDNTILFMMNLQFILESKDDDRMVTIQAVWNCRDEFKSSQRTLVLLVPDIKVPQELINDVVILDVPLPTNEELSSIVTGVITAAKLQPLDEPSMAKAVDAISGLSAFPAENALAMSLTEAGGMDYERLWDQKRNTIKQLGGLSVETRRVRFDDLGGLFQAKKFVQMIIAGKYCPRLVVRIDEIDRQTAGINDSSGVGGDAYGTFLTSMQDYGWDGALFPGFAGTGKTELGNAMGTEAGGLYLSLDLGGMQDKYVGESQKKIRAAMKMLYAMGGERVFFIGTTNRAEAIRPELKSRFTYGIIFFDLPTEEEQAPIWEIYVRKFSIPDQNLPRDVVGWTGREIRACCKRADEFRIPLESASKFISPVIKTMGDQVEQLRKSAHQKYLSASREGLYNMIVSGTDEAVSTIKAIGT